MTDYVCFFQFEPRKSTFSLPAVWVLSLRNVRKLFIVAMLSESVLLFLFLFIVVLFTFVSQRRHTETPPIYWGTRPRPIHLTIYLINRIVLVAVIIVLCRSMQESFNLRHCRLHGNRITTFPPNTRPGHSGICCHTRAKCEPESISWPG